MNTIVTLHVAKNRFFAAILSCVLMTNSFTVEAQQTRETAYFPYSQEISLARQALAAGDLDTADAITTWILNQNSEVAEALLIRALLLRAAGRWEESGDTAATAWRFARDPALRFEAAMLSAEMVARQERLTLSQFWLRRADQAAPDEARRSAAAGAYEQVRRRNPFQVKLRFAVRPSNNVNNGAESLEIDIGGLPFQLDPSDGKLGGVEASAGLSLSYLLFENSTVRTDFLSEVSYRKVWLGSDASTLAPTARNSDFDFAAVVAGVRHQRLIWPDLGPTTVTGVVGKSWYGGEELSRWTEIFASQLFRHSETSSLRFGIQGRFETRLDDAINDYDAFGASVEYLKNLGGEGSYALGLWFRDYSSDAATIDSLAYGVSATRVFGKIGPVLPSVGLRARTRDYREWSATPGGRGDRTLGLQIDLTWPELSYYGFVPQTSLTARRTWSDVEIYDRNEIAIGITAVSRF